MCSGNAKPSLLLLLLLYDFERLLLPWAAPPPPPPPPPAASPIVERLMKLSMLLSPELPRSAAASLGRFGLGTRSRTHSDAPRLRVKAAVASDGPTAAAAAAAA